MLDFMLFKHWSTLKKLIWLKAAALSSAVQKTISGAILSIKDALAMPAIALSVDVDPVQDLHGYDNPWPAGGGKNLFNATARPTRLTFADGVYTLNEAPSTNINIGLGTVYLEEGKSYILSGGYSVAFRLYLVNGSGYPTSNSGDSSVFTPANGSGNYSVYTVIETTATVGKQIKPMVRLSSQPSGFVPYSNTCPISGWTGCKIYHRAQNLWNEEWEKGGISTTNGGNINQERLRSKNLIPLKVGETYCFHNGPQGNASIYWYDESGTYAGYASLGTALNVTITALYPYIRFVVPNITSYSNNISINYPATDTEYHAYSSDSQTYSITFPDAAGTVYGGTLDVTNGVLTVDRAIVTRTSSDVASGTPISTVRFGNVSPHMSGKLQDLYAKSIANYAKYREYSLAQPGNYYITGTQSDGGNAIIMWKLPSGLIFADKTAVDAWLAEHPFVCVYPLHVPQTYQLTPQEVTMLLGNNTIWADTGDISLTYMADGRASDVEALGILLAGRYVNTGAADEATDAEALNILLGGNR